MDNGLAPIPRKAAPLRHQVLDGLRRAIITGQLAPGQRLTERELTGMMAVSRTVIREALRQLETEGLVAIVPNKGPVVRELSRSEAHDLYRIRAVLEGLAARLFAEQAGKDDIRQLERHLDQVAEAYRDGDANRILDAKNVFYDALYAGAKSAMLRTMLASLHARIWRWRALGLSHPRRTRGRSAESVRNLRAMVAAIKSGRHDDTERLARGEVHRAAAEVMRLLPIQPACGEKDVP